MADKAVLGLDIGTSRIKFVEARAGRSGPIIVNVGMGMTPRDTIANGVIVDPDTLGAAVRQVLAEYGVRTRSVVSSVASQSSLVVRPIEVPRMSRDELKSTMQWEVDRHIPFAASEVVMSFEPLVAPEELPEEAQNMEVLLAVAQEDMIEAHVQTLFNAGLDPVALDVEPLSACRSLIDVIGHEGAYDRTYALLNIGANTTDLSIFRPGGLMSFTRPIPIAGDSLTNAVAEALGYEFHEAERAKTEQGRLYVEGAPALTAPTRPAPDVAPVPPPGEEGGERVFDLGADTGPAQPPSEVPLPPPLPAIHAPTSGSPERQVYDAILPAVVELVTEVRRSLEYYANRFPESRVDKMLLYGGTARLGNFAEFVANEVGMEVEVGDPFQHVTVD
ncbi:MAG: type IV pilus assembly protein PilM, partial [Armatimonadetes bacterium]|nr:type IV pilus assembly protein PilM [Armatimonadota bacterium]